MFRKMNLSKYAVSIFLTVFMAACAGGINLFSDADDVQLGMEVDQQIRQQSQEYPIYNRNPAVKEYINNRIFQPLLSSAAIEKRSIYPYELELIDRDDVLNAFALPGGKIYLYTGLIKYLDSEAALAGILGHEIAHAERRHATKRMTAYYGVSMLLGIVLGQNPGQIVEIAANLFVGIGFLANSRSHEDESDRYSVDYMQSTIFYPGGVKFFFEKLRDDGKIDSGGGGIATFLSTHPDPIARIASTNQRLTEKGYPVYSWFQDEIGFYKAEYRANIIDQLR
ncbi:MAG: M48 family metalloprotease [Ignavibacteriaceae bacterium]|nr:M48 family metalloprotease [Ignavibacteriaceae bacterium]